jgi:hypothetical protein
MSKKDNNIEQNTNVSLDSKAFGMNLNINQSEEINVDFLYSWQKFGKRPNKIQIPGKFETDKLWSFIEKNIKYKESDIIIEKDVVNEFFVITTYIKYLIENDNLVFVFKQIDEFYPDDDESVSDIYGIIIYYKDESYVNKIQSQLVMLVEDESDGEMVEQKSELKNKLLRFDVENGKFNVEFLENESSIDYDNIDMYYNSETFKDIKKLIKNLKSNQKGLSMIFGGRGYGKTTLMTYLMKKIDKKFIYIPSHVIEHVLHNYEFLDFLKLNKDTIFILDDCENYFSKHQNSPAVNNLLQIIDGVKSDSYNSHFILVMNQLKSLCDDVLFECNNLLDVIEVNKLNVDECKNLADHLKIKTKYTSPHKLNDVIKGFERGDKKIGYI